MARVRLLILDVDGVLTDGKLYIGPDGQQWRTSHVRDGLGIKKLIRGGITPVVISGRPDGGMESRMRALGVEECHWGQDDKWPILERILSERNIASSEVAAMGDDEPDLELMQRIAIGICPADAIESVRLRADFVTPSNGGEGAVREAAEWLLRENNA